MLFTRLTLAQKVFVQNSYNRISKKSHKPLLLGHEVMDRRTEGNDLHIKRRTVHFTRKREISLIGVSRRELRTVKILRMKLDI